MFDLIKNFLNSEGINRIGCIDISECDVINQRLMPDNANSVIIFCIPYRTSKENSTDGFSEYARVYDYHLYCNDLYKRLKTEISKLSEYEFWGFCDHSPINEKLAAAKCGLGVIGRNSLFIDNVYGSFVFIGSIFIEDKLSSKAFDIKKCLDCGRCISACPTSAIEDNGINRNLCLSAISQKKNKTYEEKELLAINKVAWGCDRCQIVCPYNEKELSPINFFKNSRTDNIDKTFINSLSDEEFKRYAFAYKGRKNVIDNINLLS